ncbi:MAG: AAA family ATPase [Phycisphaerae bacterium]
MIERLYIDNFRTLVNAEIKFSSVSLLLGPNGAGKSTILDVLRKVKLFVGGTALVSEIFPSADLTRWQTLDDQAIELDLRADAGLFQYTLKLNHAPDHRRCRVAGEKLSCDGMPLFNFADGEIQLFNDQHQPGPKMSYDWNRSGLSAIYPRPDNKKLTEFKQRLQGIVFLRPCPPIMDTDSQEEAEEIELTGRNFPSWIRYIGRQDISQLTDLLTQIRQAIDGFISLRLEGPADSTITLRVMVKPEGAEKPIPYKFSEISDGQRQLIVLHSALYAMSDSRRILFLDEPDNYLSPREVQPLLTALMDAPGRTIGQAIIISHHPEVIDHLATEKGIWIKRDGGGPTRVRVGPEGDTAPLKPSEVEARGW